MAYSKPYAIKRWGVHFNGILEAVRLLKEEFHAKMEEDPKGHFKEFGEIADFEYKDGTLTAYAYGKAYGKSYTRTTEVVADILEQLERLSRDTNAQKTKKER